MAAVPPMTEPRYIAFASRLAQPLLQSVRQGNEAVWQDNASWKFGFYFGKGDRRLWVPRPTPFGAPHPEERVINFCHPAAKGALRILVLAYVIGILAGAVLLTGLLQLLR